jgi:predicted phage terminase large subunit-like protein
LLTSAEIERLKTAFPTLPEDAKRKVASLLAEYNRQITLSKAKDSFIDFILHVYPNFKIGRHHRYLASVVEGMADGTKRRTTVSIPPRHSKSETISYLAPAWLLGKFPEKKIILASHTADLAIDFGRRVRNLIDTDLYKEVFPDVSLQADSKSAGRWGTNHGGTFFAVGVGGALAGRGADFFLADDLHSEQDALQNRPEVFLPVWEWFQTGPLQRLMPGGSICLIGTRWSRNDVIGMAIEHSIKNPDSDQWEVVEFPAIVNNEPLWPEFWSLEELLSKKATMDPRYWAAQYEQNPVSEEGALLKRDWWIVWPSSRPPPCEYTIMSLDAAQEAHNRADYNALTLWGVFDAEVLRDGSKGHRVILLNSIKKRLEFPELKELVLSEYREWEPDTLLVEKKSNGAALYQELRRLGIPVAEFTPGKGQDKISRVNAIADIVRSGQVYIPDTRWAWELVDECQDFPSGRNDDLVDATTLALARFRAGGFIRLPSDEADESSANPRRRAAYY